MKQTKDMFERTLQVEYEEYKKIRNSVRKYHQRVETCVINHRELPKDKPSVFIENTGLYKTKKDEYDRAFVNPSKMTHYQQIKEFFRNNRTMKETDSFLQTVSSWCRSGKTVTSFYSNLSLSKEYPKALLLSHTLLSDLQKYKSELSKKEKETLCRMLSEDSEFRNSFKQMLLSSLIMKAIADLASQHFKAEKAKGKDGKRHKTGRMELKDRPNKKSHHLSFTELAINSYGSTLARSCFEKDLSEACSYLEADLNDLNNKSSGALKELFLPFFARCYSPVSCGLIGCGLIKKDGKKGYKTLSDTKGENAAKLEKKYYYYLQEDLQKDLLIYTDYELLSTDFEIRTELFRADLKKKMDVIFLCVDNDPDYVYSPPFAEIRSVIDREYKDFFYSTYLEDMEGYMDYEDDDFTGPDIL